MLKNGAKIGLLLKPFKQAKVKSLQKNIHDAKTTENHTPLVRFV